jgi:hypothetical protein
MLHYFNISIHSLSRSNFTNPISTPIQQNPTRDRLETRGLIDTGADLSFISDRLAGILRKRGVGVEGTGNYKVIDAFLKVHFFNENITFNFIFKDLINLKRNPLYFSITCVVVDIPMSSDLIMGLKDIKRMNVFSLLPHLVEEPRTEIESSDEDEVHDILIEEPQGRPRIYKEVKLCMIYESEWIDEGPYLGPGKVVTDIDDDALDDSVIASIDDLSREMNTLSFGSKAYERDDISEMDHDRFEAIPTDALKSHEPSIPSKIFGPDELREGFVELLTRYQLVFSKEIRSTPAKITPIGSTCISIGVIFAGVDLISLLNTS